MSVDFPRGWEITRASKIEDHHQKCSWRTDGLLCDCDVLMKHPETVADSVLTHVDFARMTDRLVITVKLPEAEK